MRLNLKKISITMMLALYPILPIYFRTFGDMMVYYLFIIFALIMSLLSNKGKLQNINRMRLMLGYIVLTLIPIIAHFEVNEAIKFLLAPIGLYIVLFNEINNHNDFNRCIDILILMGGGVAVFGILQEITGFNVFSLINNAGADLTTRNRMGLTRIDTSFSMPINYCNYLMVISALTLYRINMKGFKYRTLFKTIMLLLLINVAFTLSRATMIAIIVILIVLLVKMGQTILLKNIAQILSIIIMTVLIGMTVGLPIGTYVSRITYMILAVFNQSFISRIETDFGSNVGAIGERLKLFGWIWDTAKDNLLFGIGRAGKAGFFIQKNQWAIKTSVENEYLATLLKYGMTALVGEIVLYITILNNSIKEKFTPVINEAVSFNFVFIALFVAYLLLFFTVSLESDARIFYTLIGLAMCYNSKKKRFAIEIE